MKSLRVTSTTTDMDGTKVSVERVMPSDAEVHIYADCTDVAWVHSYLYGEEGTDFDEREIAVSLGVSTIRFSGKRIKDLFEELKSTLEKADQLTEDSVV